MNNPAASGGESDLEEIEALEPPCARQWQTSAKVSKGRCPGARRCSVSLLQVMRAKGLRFLLAGLSAGRTGPSPARRRTCQDEHARKQPPAAACARRIAAKSAPAGQRQIRNHSVPSTSASGFGETRLRRFTVIAACCADLSWIYRGSLPLSTP
jgi:hypothetical protein